MDRPSSALGKAGAGWEEECIHECLWDPCDKGLPEGEEQRIVHRLLGRGIPPIIHTTTGVSRQEPFQLYGKRDGCTRLGGGD
jgi:hypothetical protein